MQHKGQLLAVGRKCDLRCAREKRLPVKVCVYFVGYDVHFQFLRLLALFQGIYLTIIAITQRSVVGGGEKAHGIGGVASKLLLASAVDVAHVHVKGAVFLAEIVKSIALRRPNGCAVFAVKVGKLGVFATATQPNVSRYGRAMVLAPGVFVALLIVIQQVAVGPNADVHHRKGREKVGSAAVGAHFIHLREHSVGKDNALGRGYDATGVKHGVVVFKCDGRLAVAVGG